MTSRYFKLKCLDVNSKHVMFSILDSMDLNVGTLIVDRENSVEFVTHAWPGAIDWNGKLTLTDAAAIVGGELEEIMAPFSVPNPSPRSAKRKPPK